VKTKARKVMMRWVAENLYRLESNGGYYALLKRGDKQFRRPPGRARAFFPAKDAVASSAKHQLKGG